MTDPALHRLLGSLGRELEQWAGTAQALQQDLSPLFQAAPPSIAACRSLQALDALTQHLEQMARLLQSLEHAPGCADAGDGPALALTPYLARLTLGGLRQRLAEQTAAAIETGEVELW